MIRSVLGPPGAKIRTDDEFVRRTTDQEAAA